MKALLIFLLTSTALTWAGSPAPEYDQYWPQWRGPQATGVAPHAKPPVKWGDGENIRWKVAIPGKGHATPVIWGDKIYVLTALQLKDRPAQPEVDPNDDSREARRRRRSIQPYSEMKFMLLAIDRKSGKTAWTAVSRQELPHEGTHSDATWASNSPVTDGEHIFAYFGSRGLFAYDMKGKLIWDKDLGDMTTRNGFGEGSSPMLHGNTILVNWDHEGDSFIVALDKRTGKEIWRKNRDEVTSWSTPVLVEQQGKPIAVVSATNRVRGYDLKNGDIVWEASGMTTNTIPSPVADKEMVYVTSGFRGNNLLAIKYKDAKGDITDTKAIAWSYDRDTPYVPSPLLFNGALYILKHNRGILSVFDAKTGKTLYGPERLTDIQGVYASPVGADGKVYLAGRKGTVVVIKAGEKLEILATNKLDDSFNASPAIAGNELYLRGESTLYCIAEK